MKKRTRSAYFRLFLNELIFHVSMTNEHFLSRLIIKLDRDFSRLAIMMIELKDSFNIHEKIKLFARSPSENILFYFGKLTFPSPCGVERNWTSGISFSEWRFIGFDIEKSDAYSGTYSRQNNSSCKWITRIPVHGRIFSFRGSAWFKLFTRTTSYHASR